jgi:hypothetical protein
MEMMMYGTMITRPIMAATQIAVPVVVAALADQRLEQDGDVLSNYEAET